MGFPKDIINIVISMKSKDEKKRLNHNYYDKYEIYDSYQFRNGICFSYKRMNVQFIKHLINYRDIISGSYRKEIVCFLTNTKTKYRVPKKY